MSPYQIPLRGWAAIPQKSARVGGQGMNSEGRNLRCDLRVAV